MATYICLIYVLVQRLVDGVEPMRNGSYFGKEEVQSWGNKKKRNIVGPGAVRFYIMDKCNNSKEVVTMHASDWTPTVKTAKDQEMEAVREILDGSMSRMYTDRRKDGVRVKVITQLPFTCLFLVESLKLEGWYVHYPEVGPFQYNRPSLCKQFKFQG